MRAFAAAGIPYAAGVMNVVVISAALSSANTNLYTTTRMLFSLARSGYAPARLAVIKKRLGSRLFYEDTIAMPVPDADAASWEIAARLPYRIGQNQGGGRRKKRRR